MEGFSRAIVGRRDVVTETAMLARDFRDLLQPEDLGLGQFYVPPADGGALQLTEPARCSDAGDLIPLSRE